MTLVFGLHIRQVRQSVDCRRMPPGVSQDPPSILDHFALGGNTTLEASYNVTSQLQGNIIVVPCVQHLCLLVQN